MHEYIGFNHVVYTYLLVYFPQVVVIVYQWQYQVDALVWHTQCDHQD